MAQQFWLGRQDGASGINLLDRGRLTVLYQGFSAPTPAEGLRERAVTLSVRLSGSAVGAWMTVREELDEELAQIADEQRQHGRTMGVLSVTLDGETWTYIDVKRGSLEVTDLLPSGKDAFATITLACRPLFRGDAVQAQNLLSAPTDPTVAAWTKTNTTATAANTTAPDGSGTGGTLLETTATGTHGTSQSVTKAAAATQYTASVYVEANGRSRVRLSLMSGANGARATFDLSAGTISTAAALVGSGWSGASAAIVADGDWWRVSIVATSDTTTTATVALELDNGSGTSYAGDVAKGVRVWGAQLEEGASAGLLLVPSYLPDSVQAAWTESGYEYDTMTGYDYAPDASNLISGSMSTSSFMTIASGKADPSGGTGAEQATDDSTMSRIRYSTHSTSPTPSGLPRAYTAAVYVKAYSGRNTPTIMFRENGGDSVSFTVNLTDGTMGAASTSGSKVTLVDREVQAVESGWYWVRVTATIDSGAGTLQIRAYPYGTATYTGNTSYGIYTWRPQIVTGDTIDDPQILTTVVVDPIEHAAVTIGAGRQSGAWVYGIPGDAPALYRAELDDNSTTVAVNRVHVGAWSGPGVLLDEVEPFSIAAASDAAAMVSDGSGNIGTSYPTMGADLDWSAVGSVSLTDLTSRRGSADVIARVKDGSSYLSQPQSLEASVTGGIYARRISRQAVTGGGGGFGFGAPLVTPGSTLVMMVQWQAWIGAGTPTMSGTGGLTWTKIGQVEEGSSRFAWWYAKDVTQPTSQIAVTWAGTAGFPAATLVEIIGAAADPFDKWASATVSARFHNLGYSVALGSATAQAHSLLLSTGLGLGHANSPLTYPSGYWRVVSSLSSGGVGYLPVTSTGAYGVTWSRVEGVLGHDNGEGWIVAIAAFKAAAASGSNITPGQWQNCVTAVDAAGNESLPTGVVSVSVPASSSAVALTWTPPATGTPTKYRVYRQHVATWAYVEVTAPATSYIWTSESVYTNATPPTVAPPVAAWRAAVSLPSGETLWRSQASASSNLASGLWEDISLGALPLPPIASGEGVTPGEARLTVEAAHLTGAIVGVNGIWLVDSAEGQTVSHRIGMTADAPADWVVDTNRDGVTSAWLRDPTTGDEAGQLAIRGQQTLSPGNAQIVVRPEVAEGASDMVAGNLSVRRLLITPRWRYLRGID